jgi:hypothetical protein
MPGEDYLTGAQAQVDSSIQAVATELLLRRDAARLLPLIHRQCLRSHRNRPVELGVVFGGETVWRTGKDTDFRVLSGIDYR